MRVERYRRGLVCSFCSFFCSPWGSLLYTPSIHVAFPRFLFFFFLSLLPAKDLYLEKNSPKTKLPATKTIDEDHYQETTSNDTSDNQGEI